MGEFIPTYSTDHIWREEDMEKCLSTDLNTIEANITALQSGKANTAHTHTEYASASDIAQLQTLVGDTSVSSQIATAVADKADANHTHTEYAAATHVHTEYAEVNHTHVGYALESHGHTAYAAATHTHTDKADLVNGVVPDSQMPSTVVTLSKLTNIMSAHHDMEVTVTPGENYSSVTGASATLVGNMLRVKFTATRNSVASGNIDNETVATFSIAHGGKIAGGYAVTFCNGTTGHVANMITSGVDCDENALTFRVTLSATAGDMSGMNPFFAMPVIIDLSKY